MTRLSGFGGGFTPPYWFSRRPVNVFDVTTYTKAAVESAIAAATPGDIVDISIPNGVQKVIEMGTAGLALNKSIILRCRYEETVTFPALTFAGGTLLTGAPTLSSGSTYIYAGVTYTPTNLVIIDNDAMTAATVAGGHPVGGGVQLGEFVPFSVDTATTVALVDAKATGGAWSRNPGTNELIVRMPTYITAALTANPTSRTILLVRSDNILTIGRGVEVFDCFGIAFVGSKKNAVENNPTGAATTSDSYATDLRFTSCNFTNAYDVAAATGSVPATTDQNGIRLAGALNAEFHGCHFMRCGNDGGNWKGNIKVNAYNCIFYENYDDGASPHDGGVFNAIGCFFDKNGFKFDLQTNSNVNGGGVQVVQGAKGYFKACQAKYNGKGGFDVFANGTGQMGTSATFEDCIAAENAEHGFQINGAVAVLTGCAAAGHTAVGSAGFYFSSASGGGSLYRAQASLKECIGANNYNHIKQGNACEVHVFDIKYYNFTNANENVANRFPAAGAFVDGTPYSFRCRA